MTDAVPAASGQLQPPQEPPPRILLVATDSDELEVLARSLSERGLQVESSASVVQAFEMLNAAVDLVIADLNLGNTTGSEFITFWRRQSPQTRFITVSTSASEEECVESLRAGADAYLRMPLNTDELLIWVERCLEARRREAAVEELTARLAGDPEAAASAKKLHEMEREAIEQALETHNGNRTHAADALGISVRTLQRKIKAWGLAPPRDGRSNT